MIDIWSGIQDTGRELVRIDETINSVVIPETFHLKIEPLIKIQTDLMDYSTKLSQFYEPAKESIEQVGTLFSPVVESVRVLGTSLAEISRTALATGELLKVPTYDFLNSPITSALNASVDAIKIGQERIISIMPDNKRIADLLDISISSQVSQINALNSIALDSLQSSPVLFPIPKTDEKISNLDEKMQSLESKIIHLENKNNDFSLTDITANIIKILENLDDEIADCFKGAMRTINNDKNEDLVGQVSESLTRVVERLPLVLARVDLSVKKDRDTTQALLKYLDKLPDQYEKDSLMLQQKSFRSLFGILRHRNAKQYRIYKKDIFRFKSLVISFESFVYTLIIINNAKK